MAKRIESPSLAEMFIEDFEVQNWKLLEKTKDEIKPKSVNIFGLYCFDLFLCHLVLGNLSFMIHILNVFLPRPKCGCFLAGYLGLQQCVAG